MSPPSYYRDPWAKLDAWRSHPSFHKAAMFRNLFPGFGIAVVAFTGYVLVDNYVLKAAPKKEEHHH
ncbi:hypothetical protein CYLTODRAFT_417334, partial [Cylindrobasidium torrendii FP15055 ss-10]